MNLTRTSVERGERLTVGRPHSRAERRADASARNAERRLGFAPRPVACPARAERESEGAAPPAVARLAQTPGKPLPAPEQERLGQAFHHDFSRVRIHAGPSVRTAAASINARAFTVGSHVALPQDEPGVLTHELAHVVANERAEERPDVVRRLSVGEWFSRLVGEGSYTEGEINSYLLTLEAGKIEDTGESDDKARQVVKQGLHKSQSLEIRKLLIEEMITGFTGDDDELAILEILQDAPAPEREWLVNKVGKTRLEEEFHGEEFQKLQALFGKVYGAKDNPVPLDWKVQYQMTVPERDVDQQQFVLLRSLNFRPQGATKSTSVATDEDLNLAPLETRDLSKTPLEHPRNKPGEGAAELEVGPLDKDGLVKPQTKARRPTNVASYPAVDPLKKTMLAMLDIKLKVEEFGQTEKRERESTGHTSGRRTATNVAEGHEDFQENRVDVEEEQSRVDSANRDRERRLTKKREREESESKGQTDTEEKGTETQKKKGESDAESETNGSEKSGGTETLDGGADFSGKFDAKLKGEIEKASGVNWATAAKWVLKLGRLAPGVYGRVLRKIGPIGEKILELFEPGEDDLEIEFDANGNFSVKGTFKSKKSVTGWREFKSKTKTKTKTNEQTDIKSEKKGVAKNQSQGTAQRDSVEASEALKEGEGVAVGKRRQVAKGSTAGSRDTRVVTKIDERTEENRTDRGTENADTTKKRLAVIDTATLSFRVQ